MTEPLKPCPFCGGDAKHGCVEGGYGGHFIECSVCGASTNLRFACGDDPRPLLVEQWNRRAAHEAQPVADERDALLAALTRLWPMIDKGTRGFVFTAERAGEVAADMAVVKAAIDAARKEQQP